MAFIQKNFRLLLLSRQLTFARLNSLRQSRSMQLSVPISQKSDGPIKYSESPASGFSSIDEMKPKRRDVPIFQAPIFLVSFAAFLYHFLIAREENDLDELIPAIPGVPQK